MTEVYALIDNKDNSVDEMRQQADSGVQWSQNAYSGHLVTCILFLSCNVIYFIISGVNQLLNVSNVHFFLSSV